MARIKQKGKAGAAKAYVTRSTAIKKLQCSLADFRRLCILKGIFPREPRHRKRANKGSSAPTSFYYAKDIAYLAHEPVLRRLREHKAFAKKLSRALGRGEWSSAKSLEDNKPVYTLDNIIKERYPTFIDALRDIDDALCLVTLFATLPSDSRLPPSLIANCARLSAEWQLYVMRSHSLRKVFLSIKGVYFQSEVMDQTITWLVPYQFTTNIPVDVDVRVMLTFLELYQTLLGFVFFKLYADAGLAYPPPLDSEKDASGAGVGAFTLQEPTAAQPPAKAAKDVQVGETIISGKDVRQTIKSIAVSLDAVEDDSQLQETDSTIIPDDEENFVVHPSTVNQQEAEVLPTLQDLSRNSHSSSARLFSPYTFFLSRETSRPLFEFMIRSFGGRIGWSFSSGSGSPMDESDPSITHVIIDRPFVQNGNETEQEKQRRRTRKYIQPQWVVDCINAGKILPEDPYSQGKTLPPHLSPFGEEKGAYIPGGNEDLGSHGQSEDEDLDDAVEASSKTLGTILTGLNGAEEDTEQLRVAELEAEARGIDYSTFEEEAGRAIRTAKKKGTVVAEDAGTGDAEKEMNKMMMSRKQRKLYEKMKYSETKRDAERQSLEYRKRVLMKEQRRRAKS